MPERKGRFTLPGGRPAFTPGWDANIDVSDAETELEDTAGDKVHFLLLASSLFLNPYSSLPCFLRLTFSSALSFPRWW